MQGCVEGHDEVPVLGGRGAWDTERWGGTGGHSPGSHYHLDSHSLLPSLFSVICEGKEDYTCKSIHCQQVAVDDHVEATLLSVSWKGWVLSLWISKLKGRLTGTGPNSPGIGEILNTDQNPVQPDGFLLVLFV